MSSMNGSRIAAMREVTQRPVRITVRPEENGILQPTSVWFGMNTFGLRQMRAKLPKDIYKKLAASIRLGKKLPRFAILRFSLTGFWFCPRPFSCF